jgi:hypothetical protein
MEATLAQLILPVKLEKKFPSGWPGNVGGAGAGTKSLGGKRIEFCRVRSRSVGRLLFGCDGSPIVAYDAADIHP